MRFIELHIPNVLLIEPTINTDERGYFAETFRQDLLDAAVGYHVNFIQDNESMSCKGVLRGLHFQLPPYDQSKLVRVLDGEVLDVAVDIRSNSPSYGQHVAVKLNSKNKNQLFIPKGFAHGFVVLSDTAFFSYKVDSHYSNEHDRGIAADDKNLNIDWILPTQEQLLSQKDRLLPSFKDLKTPF